MHNSRLLVAEIIKTHRVAKKYSQEKLAFILGISQEQVHKIESGKFPIYYEKLIKIAEALDIPMERFSENVKNKDLLKEAQEKILKQKELIEIIEKYPDLEKAISQYSKYSKNLKDVSLARIIGKLATYPPEKKQTALNIIMKGKI